MVDPEHVVQTEWSPSRPAPGPWTGDGSGSHVGHFDGEGKYIGPLCTTSNPAVGLGLRNVRLSEKTDQESYEERKLRAGLKKPWVLKLLVCPRGPATEVHAAF